MALDEVLAARGEASAGAAAHVVSLLEAGSGPQRETIALVLLHIRWQQCIIAPRELKYRRMKLHFEYSVVQVRGNRVCGGASRARRSGSRRRRRCRCRCAAESRDQLRLSPRDGKVSGSELLLELWNREGREVVVAEHHTASAACRKHEGRVPASHAGRDERERERPHHGSTSAASAPAGRANFTRSVGDCFGVGEGGLMRRVRYTTLCPPEGRP